MQMEEILYWIATNIIGQPAFLVGLVVLVGLIAQRKSFSDTMLGTVKTMVGFLMMSMGAGVLVEGVLSFQTLIAAAFGTGAPPSIGMGMGKFIDLYGGPATVVMAIGFLIQLVIARVTPFRNVYLTGHLMWWVSLTVLACLIEVFPAMPLWNMIGIAAVIMAIYWTIQPLYIHKYMKIVRGADDIAYGHTSSSACYLAALFGKFVGKPEESSEKVKIPETIGFLKDVTAGTGVVIGLVMFFGALAAGAEVVQPMAGDMNYIVWSLLQALNFAAGLTVLLAGVRLILAEIVPAFKGISEKIIPGARPALDCPVIFPRAPTAVLIGFLASTAAFLPLMIIFAATGFGIIIPPMIMLFFVGGATGVFGNATGGWKGALLGGLINGTILAFGQAISYSLLPTTAPDLGTLADPDWYLLWIILLPIFRLFGGVA